MKKSSTEANVLGVGSNSKELLIFSPKDNLDIQSVSHIKVDSFFKSFSVTNCCLYQTLPPPSAVHIKRSEEGEELLLDEAVIVPIPFTKDEIWFKTDENLRAFNVNKKTYTGEVVFLNTPVIVDEYSLRIQQRDLSVIPRGLTTNQSIDIDYDKVSLLNTFNISDNLSATVKGKEAIALIQSPGEGGRWIDGGKYVAYDLNKREVLWSKDFNMGKTVIYDDLLYSVHHSAGVCRFDEYNLATGECLRSLDLFSYTQRDSGDFFFSGFYKVYNDIVVFTSQRNRKGKFAIIDRKNMTFQEFVMTDTSVSASIDDLHWLNNKLYVLDMNSVLHVFE